MSGTTNTARKAVLIVVGVVLTVLAGGALGIRTEQEREADRRASVEQYRPDAPAPFPDPFLDRPRR
ncbi:hypothetical protein [Streptomyces sp. S.PNR 29]|uniref:hypothetical protein n=1 Tax=Streptomyces sp. S.PNR 29 TaxID=2973805 RepID=UPI0025B10447|nr:hypothetical protein [Streptomyces sp. S.PNR 29]MDN0198340.1 hypothetical protein [Streptomyces sp. S.PNR 29]